MVNDAEKYKEEFEKAKARVDKKNEPESYISNETVLNKNKLKKLSEEDKTNISSKQKRFKQG